MQPNQQDSNSQSAPSAPLPYQVPDYLHLDPVNGQVKKSNKKPLFIIVVIVFFIILVAGAITFYLWQQKVPEQRLYGAFENLLQTPYVSRSETVTPANSTPILTADGSTDFTHSSAPKSTINYHFVRPSTTTAASNFESAGSLVVLNDTNFYGRLSKLPTRLIPKGAALNNWYTISNPTATTLTNTAQDFDYAKLRYSFNTVYGILSVGDLSANNRTAVINYIQTNKIYTIISSNPQTVNGKKATVYSLKVNYPKLSDLDNTLANILNIDPSKTILSDNGTPLTIWVDNNSDKIIKLSQVSGSIANKDSVMAEETFAYPTTVSITAPANAPALP